MATAPAAALAGAAALAPAVPAAAPAAAVPAAQAWYSENYKDVVAAKGWDKPDAVLESYVNLEKVAGLPADQRADRVLFKPGDTATPEEMKVFRERAGFTAPADVKEYGFTDAQLTSMPVLKEAAQWAKDAGLPKDAFMPFVDKALTFETAQVAAWNQQSEREVGELRAELGDKFDDMVERGRRFVKGSGLEQAEYTKIEMALGTKRMLQIFAEAGRSIVEASAPAGARGNTGSFTTTPVQAREAAIAKRADPAFQARFLSPNPTMRNAAIAEIEALDKLASGEA